MKRTALKRHTPMRRNPPRRIARETAREKAYKVWIHTRRCVGLTAFAYTHHRCDGPVQGTGLGLKAPNRRSVPMCPGLHRQWETHAGVFTGWTKEGRRHFMDQQIAIENAAFDELHAIDNEKGGM